LRTPFRGGVGAGVSGSLATSGENRIIWLFLLAASSLDGVCVESGVPVTLMLVLSEPFEPAIFLIGARSSFFFVLESRSLSFFRRLSFMLVLGLTFPSAAGFIMVNQEKIDFVDINRLQELQATETTLSRPDNAGVKKANNIESKNLL
jgi:hypothetical protein